jgi:acetyl-CoA synthetase
MPLACGLPAATVPSVSASVECSLEDRLRACRQLYAESLRDSGRFWRQEAMVLDWLRPPTEAFRGDLRRGDVSWFSGGLLSPAWNAVDRHAVSAPDRTALLWARAEGDIVPWNFSLLRQESARMAQVLLTHGVRWGDRVVAYLPETPTLAMLYVGCARIGAVPVAVPATASSAQLERVVRATRARVLVTTDEAPRPTGPLPLWEEVEDALGGLGRVEAVLVERRTGAAISLVYGRDHDLGVALSRARPTCPMRGCDAEDPLLLVAGSEDAPPTLHAIGGFLVASALCLREVVGIGPATRLLCTEGFASPRVDVLWGAWVLGGTLVLDERGDAPTRQRALGLTHIIGTRGALAAAGPEVLGVSMEGAEAAIAPLWSPDGSGMLAVRFGDLGGTPLFGVDPVLVDTAGRRIEAAGVDGELCVRRSWPAQPRSLEQDHARFVMERLERFPGLFRTGRRCRRLPDGSLVEIGQASFEPSHADNVFPLERPIGRA